MDTDKILDQSAKKVVAFVKTCDDVDLLNALSSSETNDFESPRTTVLGAISARLAVIVTDDTGSTDDDDDDDSDDSGNDDSNDDDSNDDDSEPAPKDLTIGPARLGKPARIVFNSVLAMTHPPAPMVLDESDDAEEGAMIPETDDDGEPLPAPPAVFPTAGQVATATGKKSGQVRSILRGLRERGQPGH